MEKADVVTEKLSTTALDIPADAKDAPLVNGVVTQDLDMVNLVKGSVAPNIDRKMAELKVNFDGADLDNDEGSPKLNDALTDEQKIELKLVLSNYFSHEYLSKDKFLISQMDYDQFIPVSIVAGLEDVKRITQNLTAQNKLDAIVKTLQEIQFVQLSDGNSKVRRVIERSTLLLREIPKTVPEKEIREIFTDDGCPPILSCEYAHNDSWYVHFGSEDDANRAYKFLRESGKLFLNKPILARFKGKSALIGSYIPPQSSDVPTPSPAPVAVPTVQNQSSSSVIAVPYLQQSSYAYSYPEQALTYYPEMYPGLTLGYNTFPMACPVVGPMSIFYPATGDQTTVEVINNRQRKSHNRGLYHSRPDPVYNNEHKQPPRFNRKRAEVAHEHEEPHHQHHHHHSHHSGVSRPPNSRAESLSSAGQMSPSAEPSHAASNSARYAQSNFPRRGSSGRGGRRNRHPDSGGSKRHGSDGPKPFELETSSFPPLSGVQVPESNHQGKAETKTQATATAENPTTNRVDQSTTTDGDFESMNAVTSAPGKFSYAQIAKRSMKDEPVPKAETNETLNGSAICTSTATIPEAPGLVSSNGLKKEKEDVSPKDKRIGKPRNRPQRPGHEETSFKEKH